MSISSRIGRLNSLRFEAGAFVDADQMRSPEFQKWWQMSNQTHSGKDYWVETQGEEYWEKFATTLNDVPLDHRLGYDELENEVFGFGAAIHRNSGRWQWRVVKKDTVEIPERKPNTGCGCR